MNDNLLFENDAVSSNESSFRNLKPGRHRYTIIAARVNVKDGKKAVIIDFRATDGERHSAYLDVFAEDPTRRRINQGDMRAIWDATGLGGVQGLERLSQFPGKVMEIEAVEGKPRTDGGAPFVNIRGAWPVKADSAPAASAPPEEKDEIPMEHPTDNPLADTPPAPAADPAPKAKGWKRPGSK